MLESQGLNHGCCPVAATAANGSALRPGPQPNPSSSAPSPPPTPSSLLWQLWPSPIRRRRQPLCVCLLLLLVIVNERGQCAVLCCYITASPPPHPTSNPFIRRHIVLALLRDCWAGPRPVLSARPTPLIPDDFPIHSSIHPSASLPEWMRQTQIECNRDEGKGRWAGKAAAASTAWRMVLVQPSLRLPFLPFLRTSRYPTFRSSTSYASITILIPIKSLFLLNPEEVMKIRYSLHKFPNPSHPPAG
jgi:hypothetical protein